MNRMYGKEMMRLNKDHENQNIQRPGQQFWTFCFTPLPEKVVNKKRKKDCMLAKKVARVLQGLAFSSNSDRTCHAYVLLTHKLLQAQDRNNKSAVLNYCADIQYFTTCTKP